MSGTGHDQDGHLSEAILLLAIDGEISPSEAHRVTAHIEACWACRARKEHIEQAITDVVEYQDTVIRPAIPPISSHLPAFTARLDRRVAELGNPHVLRRLLAGGLDLARTAATFRVAWAAAVLLIAVGLSYLVLVRKVPPVSASGLLRKAEASESSALRAVSQPVVYQKLRIVAGRQTITRSSYRDPIQRRNSIHVDGSARDESQFRERFRHASLDWDDPLSPAAFNHWREGVADRREEVVPLANGLLQIRTSANSGSVAEALYTVRMADFHPIAQIVKLRDDDPIEVSEIEWRVISLNTLPASIFAPAAAPKEVAPLTAAEPAPRAPALMPSAAALADAEMEARLAVHSIGADVTDEIEIRRGPGNRIVIEGLTSTEERKQQLIGSLEGVPLAKLRVRTLYEAAAEQDPPRSKTRPLVMTVESAPLLDQQLKQRFPDVEERTAFINQTLALAQETSARAWALRRLADRYTSAETAGLSRLSHQKLTTLLSDHAVTLRQDVSWLQEKLLAILPAPPAGTNANASPVGPDPHDWREQVKRVHSSVQTANEAINVLLGGASPDTTVDAEKLKAQLRTTLMQLQADLQALGQQVQGEIGTGRGGE